MSSLGNILLNRGVGDPINRTKSNDRVTDLPPHPRSLSCERPLSGFGLPIFSCWWYTLTATPGWSQPQHYPHVPAVQCHHQHHQHFRFFKRNRRPKHFKIQTKATKQQTNEQKRKSTKTYQRHDKTTKQTVKRETSHLKHERETN